MNINEHLFSSLDKNTLEVAYNKLKEHNEKERIAFLKRTKECILLKDEIDQELLKKVNKELDKLK